MIRFYLILASIAIALFSNGQTPLNRMVLDINNLKAPVQSNGRLFAAQYSGPVHYPGLVAPAYDSVQAAYSGDFIITGKMNGNVIAIYNSYQDDMMPGPISNVYNTSNPLYNKLWPIWEDSITYHVWNHTQPGYVMPACIRDWPANGDTTIGQSYDLAPYTDVNGNKMYDPQNGDYPTFCGDFGIYYIFNSDTAVLHGSTWRDSMLFEIHGLLYGYNDGNKGAIHNTIFNKYEIRNHSVVKWDSVNVTLDIDYDIGCSNDDYIGCDVMRNIGYAYNGDGNDEDCNGGQGYGNKSPALGCMVLNGLPLDDDQSDNGVGVGPNQSVNGQGFGDAIADNEKWGMTYFMYYQRGGGVTGDPQTWFDYFNYSRGIFRDGTHLRYGGGGHYSTATDTVCRFAYPDASDFTHQYGTGGITVPAWSETTVGNTPFDRRGLIITGPSTIPAGGKVQLEYAFVFGQDTVQKSIPANIALMLSYADTITDLYRQQLLKCNGFPTGMDIQQPTQKQFNFYPNPTSGILQADFDGVYQIEIVDVRGRKVFAYQTTRGANTMDVADLAAGVYVVRVSDTSGPIYMQKLVKSRN